MPLSDFLEELNEQVEMVVSSDFKIEITETNFVPNFDDPDITYDNLDAKLKRCKRLESCVLYVDIRGSARISAERHPQTLAKVYSSFVKAMIGCGRYYGGHVRNIIGDRVMVVFDRENCFTNSVNTAILMNTVNQYILNKKITNFDFMAGIGIDYGKMLITKAGAIRRGAEKEFYRSLVWLGRPANIASRLTDIANKAESYTAQAVHQGFYYPNIKEWHWMSTSCEEFVENLTVTHSPVLHHKNEYFNSLYLSPETYTKKKNPPILMTEAVFNGYKREQPNSQEVKNNWIRLQDLDVKDYSGEVYGFDVTFSAGKALK